MPGERIRGAGRAALSVRRRRRTAPAERRLWWGRALEALALLAIGLVVVTAALGRLSAWTAGREYAVVLLPAGVLLVVIALAAALGAWTALRGRLTQRWGAAPPALALALALIAVWLAAQPAFHGEVESLRRLVGGAQEAERATIAHQVFASYRRARLAEVEKILERGRVYEPTVHEAAAAFRVDPEVLMGIAATESSFHPRDSADGGRGLFQITSVPEEAIRQARHRLGARDLDPLNQRHNAFVAAATLRCYLDQMKRDLFLGLLAYNIGPRNGGLQSIMRQYGARDFVTIQPYLKQLPRDYPIRVLSAALSYRLWRREGRLPRYEEGANAARIQEVGIPGLDRRANVVEEEREELLDRTARESSFSGGHGER